MIALMTKTDTGWEPDKYLSQPEKGLLEQQLTTTYYDEDGQVCQLIVTRKFFSGGDDYNDSTYSKVLG